MKQAPCNSCAAQATVSSLESCLALTGGTRPLPLSAQQLVDCTLGLQAGAGTELSRQNRGCTDGFPDLHFQYVMESGGKLQTEEEYPLQPDREAGGCPFPSPPNEYERRGEAGGVKQEDYEYKFFSEESLLQSWVGQHGPAVTNVDVTPDWQFYGGGVFYSPAQCEDFLTESVPPDCSRPGGGYTCLGHCKTKMPAHCSRFFRPSNNSHSVTVVGYGTDGYGWDFWKIKNSWGPQWGEGGFIRLYRGLGHCGVGSYVAQPICQPGSTRGLGAPVAPGPAECTGATGVSTGAVGSGVSGGLTPLAFTGIAGTMVGGLAPVRGLGVPGAGGEECAGAMRCRTPAGQCCNFLIDGDRGRFICPQSC